MFCFSAICGKRLGRIGVGGKLNPKKPSEEDIDQSRLQIFRQSMFGGTLEEVSTFFSDPLIEIISIVWM